MTLLSVSSHRLICAHFFFLSTKLVVVHVEQKICGNPIKYFNGQKLASPTAPPIITHRPSLEGDSVGTLAEECGHAATPYHVVSATRQGVKVLQSGGVAAPLGQILGCGAQSQGHHPHCIISEGGDTRGRGSGRGWSTIPCSTDLQK